MNILRSSLILFLGVGCAAGTVVAQSSIQKCAVEIGHAELSYKHQGGPSSPELRVTFSNRTSNRVTSVTFTLSTLDSGGYPRPYPNNLSFNGAVDAGKTKLYSWSLDPLNVDIHRTGEALYVDKVEFEDAPAWIDDGSESCDFKVDYHPKQ
jgi:hypothetical protein